MASDKKPSIYYNRGTIGSSDELDEYGVWVKGEPQDLTSLDTASQKNRNVQPENSDEASAMTKAFDEADLAEADFDEVSGDDSDLSGVADLPDLGLPAMEDLSADADGEAETGEEPEEILDLSVDFDQDENESFVSGEDLRLPESDEFSEAGDDDFALPEIELDKGDASVKESNEAEELGFTEVSPDDFSDFTGNISPAGDETLPDFAEAISSDDFQDKAPPDTKSPPDLSTQLLMRIADELSSIRAELATLKKELAHIKSEAPEPGGQGFFNEAGDDEKIALTGDEMDNILNVEDSLSSESGDDSGVLLTEKESDIQPHGFFDEEDDETISLTGDELDNILNSADFTEETGADAAEEPVQDPVTDILDDTTDEISLDEPAVDDAPTEDEITFDDLPEDLDLDVSDTFSETEEEEDFPDTENNADEELKKLREEGVHPMVEAPEPEDTDFLMEDPLAREGFEPEETIEEEISPDDDSAGDILGDISIDALSTDDIITEDFSVEDSSIEDISEESLDLSDAVIDEPDLSALIQDNPVEEPSLEDISIDLDLDEDKLSVSDDSPDIDISEEELDSGVNEEISLPPPEPAAGTSEAETFPPEEESDESFTIEDNIEDTAIAEDIALPDGFVVEADESITPEENTETHIPDEDETPAEEISIEEPGAFSEEADEPGPGGIPSHLKKELKTVLFYMDQLLESLPDEKIEEFARSEYFDTYKKLFKELGLA
jgi:hypothetical protein